MPELTSLQTLVRCDECSFRSVTEKVAQTLGRMGVLDDVVEKWLMNAQWPSSFDPDFPYAFLEPDAPVTMRSGDDVYQARVHFFFDPALEKPGQYDHLVELSLLFPTESMQLKGNCVYTRSAGKLYWRILREFTTTFPEFGMYVTNEAQDVEQAEALKKRGPSSEFWSFELALIPHSLLEEFLPVPEGCERYVAAEWRGFAYKDCWGALPWSVEDAHG